MVRRLAILAGVALLALPAGAHAHAVLETTSPAANAVLARTPSLVSLRFDEAVAATGAELEVIGSDGRRYDSGPPTVRGPVLSVAVRPLPQGTAAAVWSAISDDGHRVSGAFDFSVGRPSPPPDAVATVATPSTGARAAMDVVRALRFGGAILLLGLVAVLLLVWEPVLRRGRERAPEDAARAEAAVRRAARALALTVPPALAAIALVGVAVEARSNGIAVGDQLGLRQGEAALAIAALALIAWPLAARGVAGVQRLLVATAAPALAIALAIALSGHAGAQSRWATVLVDWLHVVAAGTWGGGVIVLACTAAAALRAVAGSERGPLALGATRRFTRIALISLAVLVVSGAIAALVLAGSISPIVDTTWGRVLIAKIVLVVLAVGVAGVARRGAGSLARGTAIEAAMIIGVIAITGVLTGFAPLSAAPAPTGRPFTLQARVAGGTAEVDINPGLAGQNGVHVIVVNASGRPNARVTDASVELSSTGIRRLPATLAHAGTAHWAGTVRIPRAGTWRVVVRLRLGEFEETTIAGRMTVR